MTGQLKLAPHFMPGGEKDTCAWLALKPAVAKFVYAFDLAALAGPETLCVGKPDERFLELYPILSGDPVALAQRYARDIFAPLVSQYPHIDAWEGPNEVCIAANEVARMQWFAAFLAEFARQMQALGRRAVMGAWAVGTPEFSLWPHYVPALQACRDHGAILSRHSYGPLDVWYSYRHRMDEAEFAKLGFAGLPLIISECGADGLGGMAGQWRQAFGHDLERYWREYLKPFTLQVNQDAQVLGACLFSVGSGFSSAWANFDIAGYGLPERLAADLPGLLPAAGTSPLTPIMEETPMPGTTVTPLPQFGDGYTVISTVAGASAAAENVLKAVYSFHNWIAKLQGADPGAGQWTTSTTNWWEALGTIFKCKARPERGHFIVLYKSATGLSPFSPVYFDHRVATWDIQVNRVMVDAQGSTWFDVGGFWVMASDCAPMK